MAISFANYQELVADYGWLNQVTDCQMNGTTGRSKRMEAFKIYLSDDLLAKSIQYRAHV
ncbi:MAG: hypothetical protein HUJ51_02620 [Eggerthellaceae bacterium]|nr:hypothetical protein [Eggerthellaceae bacterium]